MENRKRERENKKLPKGDKKNDEEVANRKEGIKGEEGPKGCEKRDCLNDEKERTSSWKTNFVGYSPASIKSY